MPTDEPEGDDLEPPKEHESEAATDEETDRDVAERLAAHSEPTTSPIDPAATRGDPVPNDAGT